MGWISNVLQIREEIWIFNVEVSRHECRRRQVRLDDLKDVAVEIVATVEEQEIDVGVEVSECVEHVAYSKLDEVVEACIREVFMSRFGLAGQQLRGDERPAARVPECRRQVERGDPERGPELDNRARLPAQCQEIQQLTDVALDCQRRLAIDLVSLYLTEPRAQLSLAVLQGVS